MKSVVKSFRLVLITLLFLNLSSIFVKRDGGIFDMFSYATRIGLYLFVLFQLLYNKVPHQLKRMPYYKLCRLIPFPLFIVLFATIISSNQFQRPISVIFPTFFLLANNMFFLYIGFLCSDDKEMQMKCVKSLRQFSIVSILGMTFITIYVFVIFGSLALFWDEARSSNNEYDVFLNVYKNVNPYRFAILIPFLFLMKSKFNIIYTVLCIVNILIAGKRGPLLGIATASIVLFFLGGKYRKQYIIYFFIASIVFVGVYLLLDEMLFQTLLYRMDPSQHSNGSDETGFYMSGRDQIWEVVLDVFFDSFIFFQLFGNGILGTYEVLMGDNGPGNAHNTWVEILYNFGVMGLFAYIVYYFNLFRGCVLMFRTKYSRKYINIFLLSFAFVTSFFTVSCYGGFVAQGYCNYLFAFLLGNAVGYKIQLK